LIVSNACRENQELLWTDLGGLQRLSPPDAPALLIVGSVTRCRDEALIAPLLSMHNEAMEAIR